MERMNYTMQNVINSDRKLKKKKRITGLGNSVSRFIKSQPAQ